MYQYAELVHWMQNSESMKILPAQVDIDLTNICNQDCFYCNSAEHRAERPVQKNYQEYISLLDKIAGWRSHSPRSYGTTHTITYPGGGEPTVLPYYEKVLEHTIDLGFLTSMTTNGTKLHKLIENVAAEKIRKIAWIGIDIDAGEEELYEKIRRSLTKTSPFEKVINNAKELVKMGANVDIKMLLCEYNSTPDALENIFIKTKEIGARMLYIRPAIINNELFVATEDTMNLCEQLSQKYNVPLRVSKFKYTPRNYKKCHQMFHFPVFCADGEIYACCEHKGNPNFSYGRWDDGDFRNLWLGERHMEVYNKTRVEFCKPCRPNISNIEIQNILNNPSKIESLYL